MPTFALERIEELGGRITFYRLRVDGRCEWEDFWNEHADDPQYSTELETIQRRMELLAELRHISSPSKWKELTRKKNDTHKDYEIKTSNLRAYDFKIDDGNAVVLIGFKKDQKKDIAKLRRIKDAYFDHLNAQQSTLKNNRSKPQR